METPEKLEERLQILLDQETFRELKNKAKKLGLKISAYSRMIIINKIKDEGNN